MSATYRRIPHAAHYMYAETFAPGSPVGHDLEEWDVRDCDVGNTMRPTRSADVPHDADYHHGYLDREGYQVWVFTRRATLSPGRCKWCPKETSK